MESIPHHFLFPSTIFSNKESHEVSTILGSCVAVCLHDPVLMIGGINHFMLPLWNGEGLPSPKYGNIAMEKLIEKMLSMGSKKNNLHAKIFGGWIRDDSEITYQIGQRNIELGVQLLKEHNIQINASSVGGNFGRKIKFYTSTGEVLMQKLKIEDYRLLTNENL